MDDSRFERRGLKDLLSKQSLMLTQLNSLLAEKTAALKMVQSEAESLRSLQASDRFEIERLKTELAGTQASLASLQETLKRGDLLKLEMEMREEKATQNSQMLEKIWREKFGGLEGRFFELSKETEALHAQNATLRGKIKSFKEENAGLKASFFAKEKQEMQLSLETRALTAALQESRAQLQSQQSALAKSEAEAKEAAAREAALVGALKKAEKKLKKQSQEQKGRTDDIEKDFQEKLRQLKEAVREKDAEAKDWKLKWQQAAAESNRLSNKAEKYQRLKGLVKILEKNLEEAQRLTETKRQSIEVLNQDLATREAELRSSSQKIELLEGEVQVLRQTRQSFEEEVGVASLEREREKGEREKLLRELEKERAQAREEREERGRELQGVAARAAELADQIQDLQRELSKKSEKEAELRKLNAETNELAEKYKAKAAKRKQENLVLGQRLGVLREELKQQESELGRAQANTDLLVRTQELNTKKVGLIGDIKGLISCYKNLNR